MKPKIKIKFQNGLSFTDFKKEVFDVNNVSEDFDFIESNQPDFIVFGPYGKDIPAPGDYIRIGYYCENIIPDMSICEWAFGVPHEWQFNHPRYQRIQWHNLDPQRLIKNITDNEIDRLINTKSGFCNFLYSHQVAYREEFFRQLSKYKKVDAPGKSMNNMPSIDSQYKGKWDQKLQFLKNYKFTIAFENYISPGYQTEKLYDSMLSNSLPIYCGDPGIKQIFNSNSFINASDLIEINNSNLVNRLEKHCQLSFRDILPQYHKNPLDRIRRKVKSIGRNLKMYLQFNKLDYSNLIDQIIMIDKDANLYKKYLTEPWLQNNEAPLHLSSKNQWRKIFNAK